MRVGSLPKKSTVEESGLDQRREEKRREERKRSAWDCIPLC